MKKAAKYCALVQTNSANSRPKQLFPVIKTVVVTLLAGFLASACAVSQPSPAAKGARVSAITIGQAQENLELLLEKDHQKVTGTKLLVRWGGTIVRIENQEKQQTLLEMVSRPLSGGGRPLHNDRSDGRFLALVPRFLDPEIVKVGRDVTVIGELTTLSSGKIGETEYLFPVVRVTDFRYWKKRVIVQPTHFPHGPVYPYLYDDPFWHLRSRNWQKERIR